MYVQCNIEARLLNHCCRGKKAASTCIIFSEFVFVALVMQHAMHMLRVTLPSVVRLALPYFSNNRPLLKQTSVFLQ
jgi:hypothetical protein